MKIGILLTGGSFDYFDIAYASWPFGDWADVDLYSMELQTLGIAKLKSKNNTDSLYDMMSIKRYDFLMIIRPDLFMEVRELDFRRYIEDAIQYDSVTVSRGHQYEDRPWYMTTCTPTSIDYIDLSTTSEFSQWCRSVRGGLFSSNCVPLVEGCREIDKCFRVLSSLYQAQFPIPEELLTRKVAVVIYGEHRLLHVAAQTWPFLKWPNVNVHFSVWDTSLIPIFPPYDYNNETLVSTNNENRKYLKYTLDIMNDIMAFNPLTSLIHSSSKQKPAACENAIYCMQEGIKAALASEDYDAVIVVRPDFAFKSTSAHFENTLLDVIINNKIALVEKVDPSYGRGDVLFIFSKETAKEFAHFDFTDTFKRTELVANRTRLHRIVGDYFHTRNWTSMASQEFGYVNVRYPMLAESPLYSFERMLEVSSDWYDFWHHDNFACYPSNVARRINKILYNNYS